MFSDLLTTVSDLFDEEKISEHIRFLREAQKKCEDKKIKTCLYPKCKSKNVTKAHSIQNNRVLNSIPDNGDLMTFYRTGVEKFSEGFLSDFFEFYRETLFKDALYTGFLNAILKPLNENDNELPIPPFFNALTLLPLYEAYKEEKDKDSHIRMAKRGRRIASIFKGFCNNHDMKIFAPIEKSDYNMSKEQNFLFAYRAFAYEYTKRIEENCLTNAAMKRSFDNVRGEVTEDMHTQREHVRSDQELRENDIKPFFEQFSTEIQKEKPNHNVIQSEVFIIPFFSMFAVSAMSYIRYDLHGNIIDNSPNIECPIHPIFFTIFPQEDKTYVIFSYFQSSASTYRDFLNQIRSCPSHEIQKIISNIVICYNQNFFLSPNKYESLTDAEKGKISKLHVSTQMRGAPTVEQLIENPPVNLFQKFKKEHKEQSKKRTKKHHRKRK